MRAVGGLLCLCVFFTPSSHAEFSISDEAPPGFEDLSTAQTTRVDLYFGNLEIGAAMATFDSASFEFADPKAVVQLIADRIKDVDRVVEALSGQLDPHVARVCPRGQTVGCGTLTPEVAGVIFDESRYRADLFVAPGLLRTVKQDEVTFLSPPERRFSTVTRFRLTMQGEGVSDSARQIGADSIWSYGRTHLAQSLRLDSGYGVEFEQLSLTHVRDRWLVEAGSFATTGLTSSLISSRNMIGVRAAASLLMRTDIRRASSTEIVIFLEERSRVDLVRDGKVLQSSFYGPGKRVLDTASLPSGSYSVDVRIINSRGERVEKHYFSRSMSLPPNKFAGHYVEVGTLTNLGAGDSPFPKVDGEFFANLGTRLRLTPTLGLEGQLVAAKGSPFIAQAGFINPGHILEQHLGVFLAGEHLAGLSHSLFIKERYYSASLQYRGISQGAETKSLEKSDLLSIRAGRQISLGFSSRLFGGSLVGRVRETLNRGRVTEKQGFLAYQRPLFRSVGLQASMSLGASYRQGEWTVNAGLSLTHRGNQWSNGGNLATSSHPDEGVLLNTVSRRKIVESGQSHLACSVLSTLGKSTRQLGLRVIGDTSIGGGMLEMRRDFTRRDKPVSWALELGSAILGSGKSLVVGSGAANTAGLIAEVRGASGEEFEVLVDGRPRGVVRSGGRIPLMLKPYREYKVTLREKGRMLYALDENPITFSVLPGNVVDLVWDVHRVTVLFSTAVDINGEPVANALIKNLEELPMTDEKGRFQVELSGQDKLVLEKADGETCEITVPENKLTGDLTVVEKLVCQGSVPGG